VSDFEKKVDPNATIELDKIDARELADLTEAAATREGEAKPSLPASRRTAPPPLPPTTASVPPGHVSGNVSTGSIPPSSLSPSTFPPSHAPVPGSVRPSMRPSMYPPVGKAKTVAYGTIFLVLLGVAIFGGLLAGRLVRGGAPPQASVSPPPGSSASPPETASAASQPSHPLKMPAVEINSP
jgi:hypothetical protein